MVERPRGGRFGAPAKGGRGRMGGYAKGPGGYCICPKCGYRVKQTVGVPCYTRKCSKCETPLTRE